MDLAIATSPLHPLILQGHMEQARAGRHWQPGNHPRKAQAHGSASSAQFLTYFPGREELCQWSVRGSSRFTVPSAPCFLPGGRKRGHSQASTLPSTVAGG